MSGWAPDDSWGGGGEAPAGTWGANDAAVGDSWQNNDGNGGNWGAGEDGGKSPIGSYNLIYAINTSTSFFFSGSAHNSLITGFNDENQNPGEFGGDDNKCRK